MLALRDVADRRGGHFIELLLDLARRDGLEPNEEIVRTGVLPEGEGYGHLPMKLFRWSELEALLSRHGTVVAASAAGCSRRCTRKSPSCGIHRAYELDLASEPGALACGQHILAVLQQP